MFKDVPVFVEHQRALRTGRTLCFTRKELQKVVDRSNKRINDTGDFAPVVIGHTSNDPYAPKPPKIGWAGPFKLGWLNKNKDKYAILADFRIEKDKVPLLKEYPRRSAEIWAEEKYEDMYLDPISLLGADTPWADMGVLYQKQDSGVEKLCYCAVAPAGGGIGIAQAPSGTNTYVPSAVKVKEPKKKKEKYAMFYGEGMEGMSDSERNIAQTIVSSIFNSPEFSFLHQLMEARKESEEGALPGENPADANTPEGLEDDMLVDTSAEEELGEEPIPTEGSEEPEQSSEEVEPPAETEPKVNEEIDEITSEQAPASEPEPEEEPEPAPPSEEEQQPEVEPDASDNDIGTFTDSSNTDEDDFDGKDYEDESYEEDDLMDDKLSELDERLRRVEVLLNDSLKKTTTQERYSKLSDLRQKYLFDENAEREKCAYSKMSDEEFDSHVADIEANYRKNPNYIQVPNFITNGASQFADDRPGAVQYSKERSEQIEAEVMKIAQRNAFNGKYQPAEEIREQVMKQFDAKS